MWPPLGAAALLMVSADASAATSRDAPAGTPGKPNKVDALFAAWNSPETPGCATAASKNGRLVLNRAYGSADLEHRVPNTPQTRFEAGSASKQVAAAAVLLLVRDGALSLDDDVRKHLPELPDYGAIITVGQLVHHTSGLRDWRYIAGLAGNRLGLHVHTNADALAITARQRSLNHAPGAEYDYTNTGYTLMAIIVERVSGKSLQAFSRERLFGPLGMKDTQWRDDFRRVVKDRAIAYEPAEGGYRQDMPFENAYGAGGLITTTADLLRWTDALQTDRLGLTAEMERPGVLNDGRSTKYAGGLFVQRYRGTREVSHSGQTAGYTAWTGRYPEHALSIVLLCNARDASTPQLGQAIADQLLPANLPKLAEEDPAEEDGAAPILGRELWHPTEDQLAALAGRYVSDEADVTLIAGVEDGKLQLRTDRRDLPPWTLSPTFQDRFVFLGGGARIIRDSHGRPAELSLNLFNLRDLRLVREPTS